MDENDEILLTAYKDKARFGCISTLCTEPHLIQDKKKGPMRPESIAVYNKVMKGVDQFDQNIAYYGYPHRFLKWWKNCYVYLCEVAVYNLFILYKNANKTNIPYLEYRTLLADQMTGYSKINQLSMNISMQNSFEIAKSDKLGVKTEDHTLIAYDNGFSKKCHFCKKKGTKSKGDITVANASYPFIGGALVNIMQ